MHTNNKKVLFIHCPWYDNSIKLIAYWVFILWDILVKNWYEVEIIHMWFFDQDIKSYIKENKFDYICISLHWFYQLKQTLDLCKDIKNNLSIPIIWWWITISYYYDELIKSWYFDHIIKWDWEQKLLDLLNNLSWLEKRNEDYKVNYLNFELLKNYKEYLKVNFFNPKNKDENIFYLNYWKWCENVCVICSWNVNTTKKIFWRDKTLYYNSADFVESIINWYNKYNLDIWYIGFHTKANEIVYISIFRTLKENNINIKIYFELFFIPSIDFIKWFSKYTHKDSILFISPESWDEKIRKQSRTAYSFTNKELYNFLEISYRLGIKIFISFSVWLYSEDMESFLKTLKMINYIKNKYKFDMSVSYIDIEPWSIILENNLVDSSVKSLDDFISFKMQDIWYNTKYFTKDEIKELHLLADSEIFCINKMSYFLQDINNWYNWNVFDIKKKCLKCRNYNSCFVDKKDNYQA